MNVTVNGEPQIVPDASSVETLLDRLGMADAVCAVEVNADLVPRRLHPERELCEGDVVEIVTLVGGG